MRSLALLSFVCHIRVVLLHTWHSSWVACTRDVMACSCICDSYKVTVLEAWWWESVGLTNGGPWVLQALWSMNEGIVWLGFGHRAFAYVSFAMVGTHWRHGDKLLHICHSPCMTYTTVMMVIRFYMYVTRCGWYTLSHDDNMFLHVCYSLWVAYTGVMILVHSCMHAIHRGWHTMET